MKKALGFIVGAAVIVGVGIYFIQKNPAMFDSVFTWVTTKMGM